MLALLVIYMFISAVAGMQLLGNPANGGIPLESRARFTDFWISMLTIFQVSEGGNTGPAPRRAVRATPHHNAQLPWPTILPSH